MYCNESSFTHSAKHKIVKMIIVPILDYGDIIYRSASKNLKLDVYPTATSLPQVFTSHHCALYSQIKRPSFHSRRLLHQFIYKRLICNIPSYLCSILYTSNKN